MPGLGPIAAHSGGALGGRSQLLDVPSRRLVVALGANLEGDSMREQARAVALAFAAADRAGGI